MDELEKIDALAQTPTPIEEPDDNQISMDLADAPVAVSAEEDELLPGEKESAAFPAEDRIADAEPEQITIPELSAIPAESEEERKARVLYARKHKNGIARHTNIYDPDKPRKSDTAFDFVELFVFTLVAVLILTSFFFRHSVVDGVSMQKTLEDGEHLIVSDAFYTPKRGDVIVFEDFTKGDSLKKPLVKRVIGLAGDRVQINSDGKVFVNGEQIDEPYVNIDSLTFIYQPLDVLVPEGKLFVMGDHRNRSTDSREIGCIDENTVLGRVLLRFYPFDRFGPVD